MRNITVTEIKETKLPWRQHSELNGTRIDITYQYDKWNWLKFKMCTITKRAYKMPFSAWFKDIVTGETLTYDLDRKMESAYDNWRCDQIRF